MQTDTLLVASACIFINSYLLIKLAQVYENKKKSLSTLELILLFIGLCFWIAYGFIKNDWMIIIFNSIALLIDLNILLLNARYQNENKQPAAKKSYSLNRNNIPETGARDTGPNYPETV